MKSIKIFVIICLLFNLSNSLDAVKNTFYPTGFESHCKNNGEESSFALKGSWVNSDIPNSISFDLNFRDGSKLACLAEKKTPELIQCPNAKGNFTTTVIDQYIDKNEEYSIKGGLGVYFVCSSLNLYSNLLLSLVILFILF